MRYKAMHKGELAEAAGVTRQTLSNWMKSDREMLAEMGVGLMQKILPPNAVKYLCEKYCIEVE